MEGVYRRKVWCVGKFSAKERTFSVPVISSFQGKGDRRGSSVQIASLVLIRKFQICLFIGHIRGKIETAVKSRFAVLGAETPFWVCFFSCFLKKKNQQWFMFCWYHHYLSIRRAILYFLDGPKTSH